MSLLVCEESCDDMAAARRVELDCSSDFERMLRAVNMGFVRELWVETFMFRTAGMGRLRELHESYKSVLVLT